MAQRRVTINRKIRRAPQRRSWLWGTKNYDPDKDPVIAGLLNVFRAPYYFFKGAALEARYAATSTATITANALGWGGKKKKTTIKRTSTGTVRRPRDDSGRFMPDSVDGVRQPSIPPGGTSAGDNIIDRIINRPRGFLPAGPSNGAG